MNLAIEENNCDVLPINVPISEKTAPKAPIESLPCVNRTIARIFAAMLAMFDIKPLSVPSRNTFNWFFFSLIR
jgi:hypothetical protein